MNKNVLKKSVETYWVNIVKTQEYVYATVNGVNNWAMTSLSGKKPRLNSNLHLSPVNDVIN